VDATRALLTADDDERRAIERALHDGVQQRLVALAVELQAARELVRDDPDAATRLLDDARANVGDALDEVRALAHRVHPPLLDSRGLVAALRMAGAATPVPGDVEGAVDADVPAAVALTVYRCFVAALGSADGDGASATIAVRTRDGALEFEIALRGASVAAGALGALPARVEALGGSLDVAPTRVTGRLPLTPPDRPRPGT